MTHKNPTAFRLACILATVHTAFLAGEDDIVSSMLTTLPVALDEELSALYYSKEVSEYLKAAFDIFHSMTEDGVTEDVDDADYCCGNESCPVCGEADDEEEDYNLSPAQVLHEDDEFLILKVRK
jgi:hypothetical protein